MIGTVMRQGAAGAALAAVMAFGAAPAMAAGVLDSLFGKSIAGDAAADKQRVWKLNEFTSVRVVDKESGAPPNQQPVTLDAAALRASLVSVQARVRHADEALFDPAELEPLVPVLTRAFSLAGPNEDVLLLSTARRGGGTLATPHAVTARLFVQGEALQFIVNDTRLEFIEAQRRTHVNPKFVFGSRSKMSKNTLRSDAADPVRADWVAFPMKRLVAAPASANSDTAAAGAPTRAGVVAHSSPPSQQLPLARPALERPIGGEVEQRLITLKRLRDANLITEEEYQRKRKEILSLL